MESSKFNLMNCKKSLKVRTMSTGMASIKSLLFCYCREPYDSVMIAITINVSGENAGTSF